MNEGRGGLLSAGGILAIIVGTLQVIVGGMLVALTMLGCWWPMPFPLCPSLHGLETAASPGIGLPGMCADPMYMTIAGGVFLVLGIIAIAGGISAVRRKSFGLALAGAICALPSVVFGILALIFISLGREEFEAGY